MRAVEIPKVVSFTLCGVGEVVLVEEECDNYFSTQFDKKEFQDLINELQSLCDEML